MNDRVRLPLAFDAAAMRTEVQGLAGEWIDHFVKANYDGEWTVLPLRASASATHPVQMIYSDPSCDEYVDTPLLEKCPSIAAALATLQCPLEAVRLMRLAPGSLVKTHRDHDLDVEHGRARLHVPVATNAGVDFRLNGEQVVLNEGECWYLRLSDPHSVANNGTADRIHLVIDAVVNPWLRGMLETAMPEAGTVEAGAESQAALPAWVPTRIHGDRIVDWREIGEATFSDPFFEHTIRRAGRRARRATTTMDALETAVAARPGLPPTAFIFHMSRCGSTLVSQLARAVPGTVAISEAPPIDDVLRAPWTEAERIAALRAVVAAVGQPRREGDRHLVIKLDAWHVFDLPLVQQAFPSVPCVFVRRELPEVVASHMRMPASYLLPGALPASISGVADAAQAIALGREAYCERVVTRILQAGDAFVGEGRLTSLEYADFPDAAIAAVQQWTGERGVDVQRRLREVASFDAKSPTLPFVATPR